MRTFSHHFICALLLAGTLGAQDEVLLEGGHLLTGEVLGIADDGRILLKSDLSPTPFEIRDGSVRKLTFAAQDAESKPHSEILHLVNGDTLPGVLVSLDAANIGFDTPYAGRLTVPRELARSVDFGVTPQRLVFSGPGDFKDWTSNDDWKMAGATLTSSSNSTIARSEILPEQFILRFRLEWVGNPSLRFYFCDDTLKSNAEADRYYFEFNSAGMQLKRETSQDGRRWHPLVSLPLKPRSFASSKVDIELRVDRFQRIIHVYVNNESQGSYRDPIGDFPEGSGILIESLAGGGSKNILSRLEIFEWDAVSQLRREEGHEDIGLDALISTDGNRFSGSAREIVNTDGEFEVRFLSPHSDNDLAVPRSRISTLYFKVVDGAATSNPTHVADLRESGRLHLSQPRLADGVLTAKHPLLGEISLSASALLILDRTDKEKK